MCVCVLHCVRLFVTPWTVAHQASLFHGTFQVRILERDAICYFSGPSNPRIIACVSCIGRWAQMN